MICEHAQISDFKNKASEWVCSGCGRSGMWADTWSYFGSIGCPKCQQEPVIEFIACSDACRESYERGKRIKAHSVVTAKLEKVKADIARLTAREQYLRRKLTPQERRDE